MAKKYSREEINGRLKATLKQGKPIVIGGAGDGFTAKLEEKGGIDIIGIYNSGRFRHFGAGSLSGLMPVGRNQDMVMDYAPEVLSMVKQTPVIAGFCAQDSRTLWQYWFEMLAAMGVSGFMNFPTVGLIDAGSKYRRNLEESGLGYDKEIEILKLAHELGFFTIGYCFTPAEAKLVAEAKVDILACHVGLTAGGLIGAESVMTLDESVKVTGELIAAARQVRPAGDFFAITHGGPMEDPESTAYVMERTEAVGYLGASSIERTPVEPAVIKVCRDFKNMPVNIPAWLKL
jgi:predicted TIM-barrel enzyme